MKVKKLISIIALLLTVMMTVDVVAEENYFYEGIGQLSDISADGVQIGDAVEIPVSGDSETIEPIADITVSGDDYANEMFVEATYSNSGASSVAKLSKNAIANYLSSIYNSSYGLLSATPRTSAPYAAGAVSAEHLKYGLASVNLMRQIAGLPVVSLDNTYNSYAQHGSVILGAWGEQYGYLSLNHTPSCPPGMDSTFYNTGYQGTSKGNIACGYPASYYNIPLFTIGYMQDEDPGNATRVGHRRWILNPKMGKTGLGYAVNGLGHAYSALYAFDTSAAMPNYDFIAWPSSGNFPNNIMSAAEPWSISLNPDKFKTSSSYLNTSSISVTVKAPNGTTKTFLPSEESDACLNDYGKSFFTINYGGYGVSNCIIFRPGTNLFGSGALVGNYTVTVNGLKDNNGSSVALSYTVDFFNPDEYRTGDVDVTKISNKVDDAAVEGFVNRLYSKCLGRTADASGLKNWKDVLISGKQSGAGVAYGFFFSPEYTKRNYSDADYVETLYEVMLGRGSDAKGKANWCYYLENGVSREGVFYGFAMSKEFNNICLSYGIDRGTVELSQPRDQNYGLTTFVARLYTKALSRNYDVNGLNDWCKSILNGQCSADDAATNGFFHSKEFQRRNLSDSDFVKTLYRTFFDREYDQAGYNAWMNQLANGVSRDEIIWGFANSREFNNLKKSYGLQ